MSQCHSSSADTQWEALLERVAAKANAVLGRFCIPPQDGEDLLQQTLVTFFAKRHEIRNPEAWMLGTLRKCCLMYWRRRRRYLCMTLDSTILEEVAEDSARAQETTELRHDLDTVLSRLPSRCRSLLHLRYRLDCDPSEAAQRLGYSASGIYKITQRCLAALTRQAVACGLVQETQDV